MEAVFAKELFEPFKGRMVSWCLWISQEARPEYPMELEEYYLREIKEIGERVFLILEGTTYREKCEDCPLLKNDESAVLDHVAETVIVPLERIREIKFYQEGI